MWGSQPRGSSMRKKLLAFAAASAVALAGVRVFAASPASAATPQNTLWSVTFSEDDCSGKTVVTMTDLEDRNEDGIVFKVTSGEDQDVSQNVAVGDDESAQV